MLLIEVNTYHGIYILNILLYPFSSYFLTWGKAWLLGISTNASVGYAKQSVLIEKHHFFELNRKMMNTMWRYLFGTKRYIMRGLRLD